MRDKREFVMLMHSLKEVLYGPRWFVSEKFDGQRCFWDGGVTRGMAKAEVPWANTQKDARYKERQVATGLWSRYGHVIHAPDWWLDGLPAVPLDGELWMGHGTFNRCRSTVSKLPANRDDSEWSEVSYRVFDIVPAVSFCCEGRVNNVNWKEFIFPAKEAYALFEGVWDWGYDPAVLRQYESSYELLVAHASNRGPWSVVEQRVLDQDPWDLLVCTLGDDPRIEGLVVRRRTSWWKATRSKDCLKVLLSKVGSGTVTGWTDGKGKYVGKIGALRVVGDCGAEFSVNVRGDEYREEGSWSVGDTVEYEYMMLTPDGKPRNPRLKI